MTTLLRPLYLAVIGAPSTWSYTGMCVCAFSHRANKVITNEFKDKDFYSLGIHKVKSERVNTTTAKTQFDNIS